MWLCKHQEDFKEMMAGMNFLQFVVDFSFKLCSDKEY